MNYDEIKNKHIAVLLSGGVDSSVVVYEFARLGLTPDFILKKLVKAEWSLKLSSNDISPIVMSVMRSSLQASP